jgi:hypothetical protein
MSGSLFFVEEEQAGSLTQTVGVRVIDSYRSCGVVP